MSLTDKEMSRRELLKAAWGKAPAVGAFLFLPTIIACSESTKTNDYNDFINPDNIEHKIQEILPEKPSFPVLTVSDIPGVKSIEDIKNLERYAQNDSLLNETGIESVSFALDIDRIVVKFNLEPGVKIGEPYKKPSPWPGFLLVGGLKLFKTHPTTWYVFGGEKNQNTVDSLYLEFDITKDELYGNHFILILNHRLLSLNGKETPITVLPYRFEYQAEKPPKI